MSFLQIALIGYLTALAGLIPGVFFSGAAIKLGKRILGGVVGFTAGLLIAFVCFDMLPESFETYGVFFSSCGMILGVALAAFAEKRIHLLNGLFKEKGSKSLATSLMLALAVALHNLPEGMAVGFMLSLDLNRGMKMAVVIAIHCLPEAIAVFVPMRQAGTAVLSVIASALVLALPMGLGAALGALLTATGPFVAVTLSFAGGIMLYMSCGHIIPESRDIWNGRFSTVGAMAGFVAGVLLIHSV